MTTTPAKRGRTLGIPNGNKKVRPGTHPTVGQLTALQQEHGLTDFELSQRAGYHEHLPAIWRTAIRNPSLQAMTDYAQVFGYEVRLVPKEQP